MKTLQNYEEWLINAGNRDTLGVKIVLTHSILRGAHKQLISQCFAATESVFERALFKSGHAPLTAELSTDDDVAARARELTMLIETQQGASLQDFAGVVYTHAQNFYYQVKLWENKSLWQYLKWWGQRQVLRLMNWYETYVAKK